MSLKPRWWWLPALAFVVVLTATLITAGVITPEALVEAIRAIVEGLGGGRS